jgi:hypothetical protein
MTETDIIEALYERLHEVRRALGVRVALDDEFDQGINCRASNEEAWLEDLLTAIEKSR